MYTAYYSCRTHPVIVVGHDVIHICTLIYVKLSLELKCQDVNHYCQLYTNLRMSTYGDAVIKMSLFLVNKQYAAPGRKVNKKKLLGGQFFYIFAQKSGEKLTGWAAFNFCAVQPK